MTPKTKIACIDFNGLILGTGSSYRDARDDAGDPKNYDFVEVSERVKAGDWLEKLYFNELGVYDVWGDIEGDF